MIYLVIALAAVVWAAYATTKWVKWKALAFDSTDALLRLTGQGQRTVKALEAFAPHETCACGRHAPSGL